MKLERIIKSAGAVGCIAACIGDFVATFIFGSFYPGYDQLHDTMSALGASASPLSGILSAWWIVMGMLFILFALAFYYSFVHQPRAKVASLLIMLYGIGEGIGSGAFKADPSSDVLISPYLIHNILGGIGVTAILALPLIIKKVVAETEKKLFPVFSNIIFALGILFIALFLFRFESFGIISTLKGLWQRLFVADMYVYLLVIDGLMIRKLILKSVG